MLQKTAGLSAWWRACRFHFVPPSFLPAIAGSVIAWYSTGIFNPVYFVLTVIGVTINHIALNMTDDYYDYLSFVDRGKRNAGNPYCGGSGTLSAGLIKPEEMLRAFMAGYIITIIIGLFLALSVSWYILAFGFFGMACAYFYTAPPIRYAYHGFGEISQLINFSFTIGMGAYFVQCRELSWEALWAILPLGFMMFAMITINEIPDSKEDEKCEKRTLVVLLGAEKGVWLYGGAMITAYAIIAVTPLLAMTTPWMYLALSTLPLFVKSLNILRHNFHDALRMAPANLLTIQIHSLTGILLIIAHIIAGATAGRSLFEMALPALILVIFYLPLVAPVFLKKTAQSSGKIYVRPAR